jgi:hypothetical protein
MNNNDIDISWIDNIEKKEKLYDIFYKEKVKTITIHVIYINKNNEILNIGNQNINIKNNTLYRKDFIDLIKQKRVFNNKKYLPFIVLKYNINCDSETILNNNWNKNYLTVEKNISDYIFEDSVAMLNDLNSMFIVMKNYKPKNNKTKKVFIKTKKRKTRRCY